MTTPTRASRIGLGAILVLCLALASPAAPARAAVRCVSPGGAGGCSATIQGAIDAASPGDTITIAAGTYVENLSVAKDVALLGAGAASTAIDGAGAGPVVRIEQVAVTISGVTVRGGGSLPSGDGGGIRSEGTLTLRDSVVTASQSNNEGGGIYNNGVMVVLRTVVSGNLTPIIGGGIANRGTLTLSGSSVRDNFSGRAAGGIYNIGALTVDASTISGNLARHDYGGGLLNGGQLDIASSTISDNTSGSRGSAIVSVPGGAAMVTGSTIAGNGPVSAVGSFGGTITLRQTILAANPGGDCSMPLGSAGYNLVGAGDGYGCSLAPAGGDIVGTLASPVDPRLGALSDGGGPTLTRAPLPDSLAVDAVPAAACALPTDQRGAVRPQGRGCDIGSVESPYLAGGLLDDFGSTAGPLGVSWSGREGLGGYQIVGGQLDALGGGPIYWRAVPFGAAQEVFCRFATVDPRGREQDLLLKVQGSPPDWRRGAIEVLYDAAAGAVRVETHRPAQQGWTRYPDIAVTLLDGDRLGARADADGGVRILRNGVAVGAVTLSPADQAFFGGRGGRIGLWLIDAGGATLDDFGGGTLPPAP